MRSAASTRAVPGTEQSIPEEEHPRAVLTVQDAADELRVPRSTVYTLIASGELPSFRIGSARRILRRELLE
jgi:excisionase family DNA binding protein